MILTNKKKVVQNFRNKDAILKRDSNYSLQFLFDKNNNKNKRSTVCVTELINYTTTYS
jgi:hypothetical protein